jgi:hypothetical protein
MEEAKTSVISMLNGSQKRSPWARDWFVCVISKTLNHVYGSASYKMTSAKKNHQFVFYSMRGRTIKCTLRPTARFLVEAYGVTTWLKVVVVA